MLSTALRSCVGSSPLRETSVAFKRWLNTAHPFDHVLLRTTAAPSWERFLSSLQHPDRRPKTVVDIGIAQGTPVLYRALPDAKYILIDPTRESLVFMEEWARKLDAEVMNIALGDVETTLQVNVPAKDIGAASLLQEQGNTELASSYTVPVRRFDHVVGPLTGPVLCKIDVQGAELGVLRGMGQRLADLDYIVVEVSVLSTLKDAPELIDIARFMDEQDFVIWDILSLGRRPLDGALAQVDLVFVPRSSPLRADRRWDRT